ncbi:MAG: Na+/H+ antiporter NhaC family protein [Verrucomicrobia bacterium]|nr:Na+/H+ antiporter NhaC family protein [Verrucomicrobiota bacterium]
MILSSLFLDELEILTGHPFSSWQHVSRRYKLMVDSFKLLIEPKRIFGFIMTLGLASLFFYLLPQRPFEGQDLNGQWYSVLPPIMAVTCALFFRNLVVALLSAFLTGTVLTYGFNPFTALPQAIDTFLLENLRNSFNIFIFVFLFALVGMIHVTYRSGGIHGLAEKLIVVARGRRSTKLATFFAGLIIFFDDYSNTVVVGSTMRNLTDRWRISREKLAYIVDSTTAPVAGLAMLSTWIAFEVYLFSQMSQAVGLQEGGYAIFIKSVPFRFYCWGTLMFLIINSLSGRDYGPMYHAEKRAFDTGQVLREGAVLIASEKNEILEPEKGQRRLARNAALPIIWVIGSIFTGILLVGRYRMLNEAVPFSFGSLTHWREAFGYATNPLYGESGSMLILAIAALTGGLLAILVASSSRVLTPKKALKAYWQAFPTLWMAAFILIMAWGMKEICTTGLHTDKYLFSLLGDRLPVWTLPLLTFCIASGMAFATGTSFGTMGILIPVLLPLAYSLGAYDGETNLYFWLTSAAILDGAIFGDHCSPISDTTVLSSIASGCDHIDHVSTQIVYALSVMVMTAITGYLSIGMGFPLWTFFLLFPLLTIAVLLIFGKKVAN